MAETNRKALAELKPCPFCGSEAKWDRIASPQAALFGVRVVCSECRAGVTMHSNGCEEEADEAAVVAWNRRAAASALREEGEPVGHIEPFGLMELKRGRSARIYPDFDNLPRVPLFLHPQTVVSTEAGERERLARKVLGFFGAIKTKHLQHVAMLNEWEGTEDIYEAVEILKREAANLLRTEPGGEVETGWRFECPECGYDTEEAGTGLVPDGEKRPTWCGLCAGDTGKDVKIKWTKVSRPTTPVEPEPMTCRGHHLFVSGKCYHCGTKATEVLDAEPGTPVEEQDPTEREER